MCWKRRRLHGDVDSRTAWSVNDLGVVLMRQGRYVEAEPLLTEAVQIWRSVRARRSGLVPGGHLQGQPGLAYVGQRRYAEAEPILVEALGHTQGDGAGERPNAVAQGTWRSSTA